MRVRARSALIAAASLFTVSAAQAASSNEDNQSQGNAALKWETRNTIVGPTSGHLGDSTLAVQVSANLDPVPDVTKPLLSVDMPKGVVVGAKWNDDKNIELSVIDDGTNDAIFKAEHTLAPHMTVFLNAFGFSLTYDYAASTLLGSIPGSAWNYDATGSKAFAPWGFTGAPLSVTAPPLNTAQIFSIPFPSIGGSQPLGGQIGLNATTSPTFIYVTNNVALQGGTPIAVANGTYKIPTVDTDFIDVPALVKGQISYSGDLLVRPTITVTSVGSFTFPFAVTLDLPSAGTSMHYESGASPIAVNFPSATFHIPLPNVKIPNKALDLGAVEIGSSKSDKVTINNTGEMSAAMTFTSSDPQFTVIGSKQSALAKGKYELEVKYTPTNVGNATADITVSSNDPNEPLQTIKVQGTASKKPEAPPTVTEPPTTEAPPAAPPEEPFSRSDDGCGCRTAPTTSDAGGFAVLAIALGAMLRRRRQS